MPEEAINLDGPRAAIVDACRSLADKGLVIGAAGNVSARIEEHVAVTATGAQFATMTPEQVTLVDLSGNVVDGQLAPTSELDLHLGVYGRYHAGAVVHTHAPMATALSCVLTELPCVHYGMLALGGPVRVAGYETFGTPELAASVLEALEGRVAALMANHGTVAMGDDLAAAVASTELLEWAAAVYWRASMVGSPRVLDQRQRQAVIDAAISRGYGGTRPAEPSGGQ
ncbi:MAG TPA: class II aldolase/adducin family protein [Solirubrobacteraceae bacterium]|jgi:L-fuculose-phosphate aldolase|nr:class II aldolase/adducin family protein [Solirubrobacteraceae bacterium]